MSRERILVADDHDSLRRGIARALSESGHDVEQADNGNAWHWHGHYSKTLQCWCWTILYQQWTPVRNS